MRLNQILPELKRRDTVIYHTVLFLLGTFFLAAIMMVFDRTEILGINAWLKPVKFSLSAVAFLGTFAWIMHYLPKSRKIKKVVSWGISISMIVEIVLIHIQSARGLTSHFNISSAVNASIFSGMGMFIAINTVLVVIVLILFLVQKPDIPYPYLLSIRLALIVFLLGNGIGGTMIGNMAHTVGGPDGSFGVPFLNWSREFGDLRISHFLGLHSIQVLPLLGYSIGTLKLTGVVKNILVCLTVLAFSSLLGFLYFQALRGVPFF